MLVAAKRLQLNFSRAAERYDAHAFLQREQLQRVAQAALEHMVEQGRIIDIGCGTGMFASVVKPERPNWWVAGVDFSYGMAQKATARCASLQGDATALPFASDSAEGIVSSLCMQWVQDRAAMMAEIHRVLKPGGLAIIATLGGDTLRELHETTQKTQVPLGLLKMQSFNDYRALAAASGMQIACAQRTVQTQYYRSVEALLTSMRAIGAGNAGSRNFIPPRRFVQMIQQYEASYGDSRGIPATWENVFLMLRKPA
jgi:malonyl-CoA O-methyltransferase